MTPTPRIRQDTESAQKALSVKVPFTVPSRLITQSSSSLTDFGGGRRAEATRCRVTKSGFATCNPRSTSSVRLRSSMM